MNIPVKVLKQNNEQFAPVTVAEAVVVNHSTGVKRLDEVLRVKLEGVITPVGSGLTSSMSGNSAIIVHSNSITPNYDNFKNVKIKYDNHGHIVEVQDVENLGVTIQDQPYLTYNGLEQRVIALGDDFLNRNGYILIRWNELG